MDFKNLKNMKLNKTYTLLSIAVLLTIFVSLLKGCSSNGYQDFTAKIVGYRIVPNLNTKEITKIILLNADNKRIVLNKTEKDDWEVLNLYKYSADSKKINSFLEALKNARIIQTVANNKDAVKRLGLDSGTEKSNIHSSANVKLINNKGKVIADIDIGKRRIEHMPNSGEDIYLGRYLKTNYYSQILFTDTQFTSSGITKQQWLDHSFPKIKDIKSIKMTKDSKTLWELKRDSLEDKFYLLGAKAKKLDYNRVNNIKIVLNHFDFYSVAKPNIGIVVAGLDTPTTLIVETFNAQRYLILIGNKEGSNYYVKINAIGQSGTDKYKKWIYLIDSNRIEALLTSKKDIIKKSDNIKIPDSGSFKMPIT